MSEIKFIKKEFDNFSCKKYGICPYDYECNEKCPAYEKKVIDE